MSPDPTEICAELLLEGAGPAVARRTWASGADFSDSSVIVQVAGKKQAGLDRLGWRDDLVAYRPFLSHTELEAFFREPSHVYDLLSSVLGLEALTAAAQWLNAARKQREDALTDSKRRLPPCWTRLLRLTMSVPRPASPR